MDPITAPVVYNLRHEKEQPTLKLNNKLKLFLEALYASIIHDQELSIHARVILLILTLCDMMQTHPAKGDSIQK